MENIIDILSKYRSDIIEIFEIGVAILDDARRLKSVSVDLKLMAVNGIVRAGKVASGQGKSLAALSGFLSDLPAKIAPDLDKLEALSGDLAVSLTEASIDVRRFINYTDGLSLIIESSGEERGAQKFDLLKISNLRTISVSKQLKDIVGSGFPEIVLLADRGVKVSEKITEKLIGAKNVMNQAKKRIADIGRSGFTASYMGTYISIESSYLRKESHDFASLIDSIKQVTIELDNRLSDLSDLILKCELKVEELIKLSE